MMNYHGIRAIYLHEMHRFKRSIVQSLVSPLISTSLYFIVFGSAIGSRITEVDGIAYGSFIVPGMIMLTLLTQSISNASFGIFFPRPNGYKRSLNCRSRQYQRRCFILGLICAGDEAMTVINE